MIDEIRDLLDRYAAWLRDKTAVREVNDFVEVTTPYLDRHNDYMQFYVKRRDGGFVLTDDSHTLDDLASSGCRLDSPKRQALLRNVLNGFGVQRDGEALQVLATAENFSLRKHSLVQAMLAVNDLFCLAEPNIATLFYEDVQAWFDSKDIRYTPNIKFTGKTGFDHTFLFVIPKSRQQPERIVEPINRPNREAAQALILRWLDTQVVRTPNSKAFALLNDIEHEVSSGVIDALSNYKIRPVPWSRRGEVESELAN